MTKTSGGDQPTNQPPSQAAVTTVTRPLHDHYTTVTRFLTDGYMCLGRVVDGMHGLVNLIEKIDHSDRLRWHVQRDLPLDCLVITSFTSHSHLIHSQFTAIFFFEFACRPTNQPPHRCREKFWGLFKGLQLAAPIKCQFIARDQEKKFQV